MCKNLIFDWSGVINDNIQAVYNAALLIFQKFGASEITQQEFKKNWVQPYMFFYNRYLPNLSHADEIAAYRDFYPKMLKEYPNQAFPGIQETLSKFKRAKIRMVILSSDPEDLILSDLKKFGLENVFEKIYSGIHDKTESLQNILKENNFQNEKTAFIGDSNHEIETGKKAGIQTIAVTWGYGNETDLRRFNPDFVVQNLSELEKTVLG